MDGQGIQCSGKAGASGHRPVCVVGGGWRVRGWAGTGSRHGIHRNQRPSQESVGLWKEGVFEMMSLRGRHKATMTFKMKGL